MNISSSNPWVNEIHQDKFDKQCKGKNPSNPSACIQDFTTQQKKFVVSYVFVFFELIIFVLFAMFQLFVLPLSSVIK